MIGARNTQFPGAKLNIDANALTLTGWGQVTLSTSEVVFLEVRQGIPGFSTLIVCHNRTDIPRNVRFWYLGSHIRFSKYISDSGFHASGVEKGSNSVFQMPWVTILAFIIGSALVRELISALGLEDSFNKAFIGASVFSASLSIFSTVTVVLWSPLVRSITYGTSIIPTTWLRLGQSVSFIIVVASLAELALNAF
jgi:hypothetical protein